MNTANTENSELKVVRTVIKAAVPLVFIIAGLLIARHFIITKPESKKKKPAERAVLVEVMQAVKESINFKQDSTGTVIPARELKIRARVSGEVVEVSPSLEPGSYIKKGEPLVKIEPVDYELALAEQQANVVRSEYALTLEQGQQTVAKHEWNHIEKNDVTALEKEISLRVPHLKKAQIELAAAQAKLKKAEIDLSRTIIYAPFDAVVLNKSVEKGMYASAQAELASIVGTDEFWVNASIPVDRLTWLEFPDETGSGSLVEILATGSNSGQRWSGAVFKLLPELDNMGRMAKILIKVEKPLQNLRNPLLLDSFVRLKITGRTIQDVFIVPQYAIHDGNRVWICNSENRLEYRTVEILWRDSEKAAITGTLQEGEKIVLTEITAAVEGMKLELYGAEKNSAGITVKPGK